MEKIMSKTNDTSCELTIEELDAVNGGIIAVLIGLLLPAPPPPPPPPVQR
jgi:bacteriocin-like protein